jgi:hypothetical protein
MAITFDQPINQKKYHELYLFHCQYSMLCKGQKFERNWTYKNQKCTKTDKNKKEQQKIHRSFSRSIHTH